MAAIFDIVEMKRRAAATESKLSVAVQDDRERNAQLLQLLESVETTLVDNQQRIHRLEEGHARAREEFQKLRNPLQDTLIGSPNRRWRWFPPATSTARADLIDRLDSINAIMSDDGEDDGDANGAKQPRTAFVRKPTGRAFAVYTLIGSLIAVALFTYEWQSDSVNNAAALLTLDREYPVENSVEQAPAFSLALPRDPEVTPQAPRPEVLQDAGSEERARTVEAVLASSETVTGSSEASETTALPIERRRAPQDELPMLSSGATATTAELARAAPPSYGTEREVSRLLKRADDQVARLELTVPSGNNALESYRRILAIQPDNEAAVAGIEQIGVEYLELANLAAAKGDFRMANRHALIATELAPDHPLIQSMAIPVQTTWPTSQAEALPAVALTDIDRTQRTMRDTRGLMEHGEVSMGLSSSAAPRSAAEYSDGSLTRSGFAPNQGESPSRDLDSEILEALVLVVPIYPGEPFFGTRTHNDDIRSHDHDGANRRAENGSGSGGGGSGCGDSGGGDSGGGDSGGGDSGGGDSGGGDSGGGDSGGGDSGGGDSGGGECDGGG